MYLSIMCEAQLLLSGGSDLKAWEIFVIDFEMFIFGYFELSKNLL